MDDNPEIRDRLNVNKSTYHNKRPRERFICFIRGAKWMKINQLNGPSPIHDTSTWLSQSIQSIIHVCYWLDMQKNLVESASERLLAITISGQQVLPSKLDACANVTTCCSFLQVCLNYSLSIHNTRFHPLYLICIDTLVLKRNSVSFDSALCLC